MGLSFKILKGFDGAIISLILSHVRQSVSFCLLCTVLGQAIVIAERFVTELFFSVLLSVAESV